MGFLTEDDAPVIWRGPMLHGVMQQFFRDVRWNNIDYLLVDMPPGTGDVALSLSQSVPVAGAVLVTTPQTVSLADTRRAVHDVSEAEHSDDRVDREHEPLHLPGLRARKRISSARAAGRRWRLSSTCRSSAAFRSTSLSACGGDSGVPIVIGEPDSPPARAIMAAAERVAQQVSIASFSRRAIPLARSTDARSRLHVPFTKDARCRTASTSSSTRIGACRLSR